MNKKYLLPAALIIVISFSAGIFTEILASPAHLQLSTDLPSLSAAISAYLKSDILTVLAAMIFACTVILMPAVAFLAIGKTFSLGFSAAYIRRQRKLPAADEASPQSFSVHSRLPILFHHSGCFQYP